MPEMIRQITLNMPKLMAAKIEELLEEAKKSDPRLKASFNDVMLECFELGIPEFKKRYLPAPAIVLPTYVDRSVLGR